MTLSVLLYRIAYQLSRLEAKVLSLSTSSHSPTSILSSHGKWPLDVIPGRFAGQIPGVALRRTQTLYLNLASTLADVRPGTGLPSLGQKVVGHGVRSDNPNILPLTTFLSVSVCVSPSFVLFVAWEVIEVGPLLPSWRPLL